MEIQVQLTRQENAKFYNVEIDTVVNIEFEEYVAAVVAAEIGNSYLEACKAQAVAARSFAISRGVLRGKTISDSPSTAQCYRAIRYNKHEYLHCILATEQTAGIVLKYQNTVINSIYTASNGGETVSAYERWGGKDYPYLISQPDPWDAAVGLSRAGSGVGMSQRGCMYAAKQGITYEEILAFYYPNTYLSDNYGKSKADIIVDLAHSRLGYPYVFGAVGEDCSPKNRDRRRNASYPSIVDKCQVLSKEAVGCDGCKYKGMQIFDCRGFTYWCLKQVGITISTVGATTQYNGNYWIQKGLIKDGMPNVVCCVFKHKNGVMSHTGLHIGDGYIIHCSGEVKEGSIDDTSWTHYAIPKGLYNDEYLKDVTEVKKMVSYRNGSQGEGVRQLQVKLNTLGFDCGVADGKYGKKTIAAVKAFQEKKGLTVDGIAGPVTLARLEAAYNDYITPAPEPEPNPIEGNDTIIQYEELAKELLNIKANLSTLISMVDTFQEELDEFLNK